MKALLIVDMQNDFMPTGALPVSQADELISLINALMDKFSLVVATQDWHPNDHVSFAANHPGKNVGDIIEIGEIKQILWPVHCVANTKGAELAAEIRQEKIAARFKKGVEKNIDSYSTFFDNAHLRSTGLENYLHSLSVKKVYLAGVATDYCVFYSALDGIKLGFDVNVILDGCRGINVVEGDVDRAIKEMKKRGVKMVFSSEIGEKE